MRNYCVFLPATHKHNEMITRRKQIFSKKYYTLDVKAFISANFEQICPRHASKFKLSTSALSKLHFYKMFLHFLIYSE